MSPFLTVKEAARLTGKSPSSIRRVIYPIIGDDQHEAAGNVDGDAGHQHYEQHRDRHHIQPNVDEVQALRLKGENFAWRISEELLRREVSVETEVAAPVDRHASRESANANAEMLAMLRRELEIKNHQITQHSELISKQMELISGLSERLREENILIGSLQQQIALPDRRSRTPMNAVEMRPSKLSVNKKSNTAAKPLKKRTGFLSRLFR